MERQRGRYQSACVLANVSQQTGTTPSGLNGNNTPTVLVINLRQTTLKVDLPSRQLITKRCGRRGRGHVRDAAHILPDVCIVGECAKRSTAEVVGGIRRTGDIVRRKGRARCKGGEGEHRGQNVEETVRVHSDG